MSKDKRDSRLASKIRTTDDLPVFSEAQITTFNSNYVDSLDDALAVLDETAGLPVGQDKSIKANEK